MQHGSEKRASIHDRSIEKGLRKHTNNKNMKCKTKTGELQANRTLQFNSKDFLQSTAENMLRIYKYIGPKAPLGFPGQCGLGFLDRCPPWWVPAVGCSRNSYIFSISNISDLNIIFSKHIYIIYLFIYFLSGGRIIYSNNKTYSRS